MARRRRTPKAQTQRAHARRRALERYGLELNRDDLEGIVTKIQRGDATFVERQSHRVSVWVVMIKDRSARVVYDRQRKTVVTFLPLGSDHETAEQPVAGAHGADVDGVAERRGR